MRCKSSEVSAPRKAPAAGAGFTLIELMIVVAIIGILAAIAVPKFASLILKSQEGATKGKLSTLRSTLHIYYADNEGVFPTDDLTCLLEDGKYTSAIPEAYVPGHHSKSNTVQNIDTLGIGMMGTVDTGMWVYWNQADDLPPRHWGDLWIGCTHEDVNSEPWTIF